jgi:predicted nucleic acid-binding protein
MYLLDTNIFLEILLEQAKKDTCKNFLDTHVGQLSISDFSLHSIGVILFRNDSEDVFEKFVRDVLPKVDIVTLSKTAYEKLPEAAANFRMDFDDIYQFKVAEEYGLAIVTLDRDFENVKDDIQVIFL